MHRHADNVAATAQRELLEVVFGDHARIADEHAAAQTPTLQVALHLLDGADIHRIAGKDPVAHRQPVAGHRQTHHKLRGVVAAVLRLAALAQHPIVEAAVVVDAGLGTFLFGVPDVVGDLEVVDGGAVGAFLSGQSSVPASWSAGISTCRLHSVCRGTDRLLCVKRFVLL